MVEVWLTPKSANNIITKKSSTKVSYSQIQETVEEFLISAAANPNFVLSYIIKAYIYQAVKHNWLINQ